MPASIECVATTIEFEGDLRDLGRAQVLTTRRKVVLSKLKNSRLVSSSIIGVGLLVLAGISGSAGTTVTYNGCQNLYTGVIRLLPSSLPAPYNTTCNTTTTN